MFEVVTRAFTRKVAWFRAHGIAVRLCVVVVNGGPIFHYVFVR